MKLGNFRLDEQAAQEKRHAWNNRTSTRPAFPTLVPALEKYKLGGARKTILNLLLNAMLPPRNQANSPFSS